VHFLFSDKGQLAAIRVVWAYDEFFSFLILEDHALDRDFDGAIAEEEKAVRTAST
jgi:polyphosphate kinase